MCDTCEEGQRSHARTHARTHVRTHTRTHTFSAHTPQRDRHPPPAEWASATQPRAKVWGQHQATLLELCPDTWPLPGTPTVAAPATSRNEGHPHRGGNAAGGFGGRHVARVKALRAAVSASRALVCSAHARARVHCCPRPFFQKKCHERGPCPVRDHGPVIMVREGRERGGRPLDDGCRGDRACRERGDGRAGGHATLRRLM